MRFTWIALPVLLAALAPAPAGVTSSSAGADDERSRTPIAGAAGESRPLEVLQSHSVELDVAQRSESSGCRRLEVGILVRPDQAGESSSSASADVQLRARRTASLDFTARLFHSLSGFLPSYSTACPPPASV